jgi:ABC-type antimicrobial peptide transport system permease subunit
LQKFERIDQQELTASPEVEVSSYWKNSWKRLKANKRVMFGLWILAFLVVMALVGPLLTPYAYYETHLPLKNTVPGIQFWFGSD